MSRPRTRNRYPSPARGVAQPGSALRSGRRGPQFKSGHPDFTWGNPWFPHGPPPFSAVHRLAVPGLPAAKPALRDGVTRRLGGAPSFPRPTFRNARQGHRGPKTDLRGALTAIGGARTARILVRVLEAVLLDVDFTLFRPGPELGPEGYERIGARHGLTLDGARYEEARLAALRGPPAPPGAGARRGALGALHGGHRDRDGRRPGPLALVCGRPRPGVGAARELLPLRGRAPGARGASRARPADRARVERPARPRGVRAPSRARRRRLRGLDEPRPREAAPVDLRGGARGARRSSGRGGDGRRQLRRRHRGRTGPRDARDPARPRRPASGGAGPDRHSAGAPGRPRPDRRPPARPRVSGRRSLRRCRARGR